MSYCPKCKRKLTEKELSDLFCGSCGAGLSDLFPLKPGSPTGTLAAPDLSAYDEEEAPAADAEDASRATLAPSSEPEPDHSGTVQTPISAEQAEQPPVKAPEEFAAASRGDSVEVTLDPSEMAKESARTISAPVQPVVKPVIEEHLPPKAARPDESAATLAKPEVIEDVYATRDSSEIGESSNIMATMQSDPDLGEDANKGTAMTPPKESASEQPVVRRGSGKISAGDLGAKGLPGVGKPLTPPRRETLDSENVQRTINPRDLSAEEFEEVANTFMDANRTMTGDSRPSPNIHDTDIYRTLAAPGSESDANRSRAFAPGKGAESNLVLQTRKFILPGERVPAEDTGRIRADYDFVEKLGEGGMGVVWLAKQTSIEREVAVKLIKDKLAHDRDQRESFLSEAVVTGDLDHPNIPPIYDAGYTPTRAVFYAMKRVQGTPWEKALKKHAKTLQENLEILLKVSDAVAFAHARGVVHRDLKPENIMLGDFGEVLVMDWGLAVATRKFVKSDIIAMSTSMGGSPAYMAPEMAVGPLDKIGPRSDIYLLGAILYEIVVGYPPHGGRTVSECLKSVRENIIRATDKKGELLDIALTAMATQPEDRYQSVQEFQQAIRGYQSHAESLGLSQRAQEDLDRGLKSGDYADFARSVFGFEQAIDMWGANEAAKQGLIESRLNYAKTARKKSDFDLGLSLLDDKLPGHADEIRVLTAEKRDRDQRRQRNRTLMRSLAAAAVLILLGSITAAVVFYDLQNKAIIARNDAVDAQKKEADARKNEEKQRLLAEQNEKKAIDAQKATAIALVAEEQAKKKAIENELEAKRQEEIAKKQEMIAKTNEEKAVIARNDAVEAEKKAVAAREKEEEQRKIAEANEKKAIQARNEAIVAQQKEEQAKQATIYENYVSEINLAAAKIDDPSLLTGSLTGGQNAFAAAREILDAVSGPLYASYRGWEYDRLTFLCQQGQRSVDAQAQLDAVAVTDDGLLMATGGRDGIVRIWDAASLKLLRQMDHGHAISSVAFSPSGKLVAACGESVAVSLWSAEDGKPVGELKGGPKHPQGHHDHVLTVQFSPSGKELLTTSFDHSARIWDAASQLVTQKLAGHAGYVTSAAWSQDGKWIITGGEDRLVLIWKQNDAGKFIQSGAFDGHQKALAVTGVALASSVAQPGRLIACSVDNAGRLCGWDLVAFTQGVSEESRAAAMLIDTVAHRQAITSVALTADAAGLTAATASSDNTVKVWDLQTGRSKLLRGHGNAVRACAFERVPGRQAALITAGYDRTARIWNTAAYNELKVMTSTDHTLKQQQDPVLAVSLDEAGKRLATASQDRTVVLWDVKTGQPERTLTEGHAYLASNFVLFDNGQKLVTAAFDQTARIWDVARGVELQRLDGIAGTAALAVSPDGKWLITGGDINQVLLWDLQAALKAEKGKATAEKLVILESLQKKIEAKSLTEEDDIGVTVLAFSPDSQMFAAGTDNGEVVVWDLASRKVLSQPKGHGQEQSERVTGLSFLPDNQRLVSSGTDFAVAVWNAKTGDAVGKRLTDRHAVSSLALSQDGKTLITVRATNDPNEELEQICVWDLSKALEEDRAEPVKVFGRRKEIGMVTGVSLSADGQECLATCLETSRLKDRVAPAPTVRAYSVKTGEMRGGKPLIEFKKGEGNALAAAFVANIEKLLTVGGNEAQLWSIDPGAPAKVLVKYGPHRAVTAVSLSKDGQWALTGGADGSIKIWDCASGQAVVRVDKAHKGELLTSVAFAPGDTTRFVTTAANREIHLWKWDPMTKVAEKLQTLDQHKGGLTRSRFSADGQRLVTTSEDGLICVWKTATGELLQKHEHESAVISADFSSAGDWVVFADTDRGFLWNVETGKLLLAEGTAIQGHSSSLTDVRFLPSQEYAYRKKVAVVDMDPKAAADKKPEAEAKADGDKPAEEKAKEEQPAPVEATVKEQEIEIRSLILRVVTTSLDGTAKIWDVSQNDAGQVPADPEKRKQFEQVKVKELLTLRGPVAGLSSVDVSSDGRNIVGGAMDGTAVIWTAGQPVVEKDKVAGR